MKTAVSGTSACLGPLMLLTLALACASTGMGHAYKLYPGPPRPPDELATLRFGSRVFLVQVDGMLVQASDYEVVELLPGEHEIRWSATFLISPYVEPSMSAKAEAKVTVELLAGHAYSVHTDRTTGPGYDLYLWIEEAGSGEVVAGRKKP